MRAYRCRRMQVRQHRCCHFHSQLELHSFLSVSYTHLAIQEAFYNDYEKTAKEGNSERLRKAVMWYADYCTPDKINVLRNYYKVIMNSAKSKVLRKIEIESNVFRELLTVGKAQKIYNEKMCIRDSSITIAIAAAL